MGFREDVDATGQVSAHAADARGGVAGEKNSGSDGGITPVDSEPKYYIDPKEERAVVSCSFLGG